MSSKDGILNLILKYEWYDKIESGEKTTEYRDYEKWAGRIIKGNYKFVRFQRGYKNPKTMVFKIKRFVREIGGQNDLDMLDVLAIELGERIE